ncbi:MAG: hypothetical protein ACYTEQ_01855 [Planctomycetota bacterium]|jgi:hypothetical protein
MSRKRREVVGTDRPSHSSLSNYEPKAVPGEGDSYIAVSLCGMTDKGIESLIPLARSWNYPAKLNLMGGGFESEGFNKYERAYVLACKAKGKASALKLELAASEKSPAVNPAFIIKNWGAAGAEVRIDGRTINRGRDLRFGHRRRLGGEDLIVWTRKSSTRPLSVTLWPKAD